MSEQTRLDELTTAEQLAVDTMATTGWTFVKSDALARSKTDVLLEGRLTAALAPSVLSRQTVWSAPMRSSRSS